MMGVYRGKDISLVSRRTEFLYRPPRPKEHPLKRPTGQKSYIRKRPFYGRIEVWAEVVSHCHL
ncbi:hypothetical protein COOONC_25077 [Cooperia oncophora]